MHCLSAWSCDNSGDAELNNLFPSRSSQSGFEEIHTINSNEIDNQEIDEYEVWWIGCILTEACTFKVMAM